MIIANDPYAGGGTHLSDVALVRPVFAARRRVRRSSRLASTAS